MLTQDQEERLLEIARSNIERFVTEAERIEPEPKPWMKKERGVFVTLKSSSDQLRGCIGKPYPNQTILEAVLESSASATQDPRFPPLGEGELDDVEIEITVLTSPEEIEVDNLKEAEEKIELGKHGLVVRRRSLQGLLLPQVPEDHGMNLEEFLDHTCRKAGLSPGAWRKEEVSLLRFQGQVFSKSSF